jgi:DNA-binding PadR family transcriptional regulator
MPIQHAVLALLAGGPSYGYELRGQFQESIGPQWGDLNIGHLYQVLDRLVRDGLAIKEEVEQSPRPDKFVYHLTGAGAKELDDWLGAPFVRQGGYRDDFFLKLFAAARLGRPRLERVLATQREAYLSELASLVALRAEHVSDPLVSLLIEAAVRHTQANLSVLDEAERQSTTLASHGRAQARTRTRAQPSNSARRLRNTN